MRIRARKLLPRSGGGSAPSISLQRACVEPNRAKMGRGVGAGVGLRGGVRGGGEMCGDGRAL